MDVPSVIVNLATYGPWGLALGVVLYVAKLLIVNKYRVKIDIGPER